ncbi:Ribonucleoside-diphosphate reductase subunit beta [compost metagenome]
MTKHTAANWNVLDDDYTQTFFHQNVMQFWTDEEIPISDDLISWAELSQTERTVYAKVLGGLTLLDTKQTNVGMPVISIIVNGHQRKAVLNFMGAMEGIHAKSYSSIYTTLLVGQEDIQDVFDWVEDNPHLQYKAEAISARYNKALHNHVLDIPDNKARYMALVASVLLESYLFYSGFYYPLYLAGLQKMVSSGEIIGLILRDESIHGLYVGMLAQALFAELSEQEQEEARAEVKALLADLHENEVAYTKSLYDPIGITDDVIKFIEYNANKAMANLALDPVFDTTAKDINPIVLNGIDTSAANHDFFSKKGSSYVVAMNVEKITSEHFDIEIIDEFGDKI